MGLDMYLYAERPAPEGFSITSPYGVDGDGEVFAIGSAYADEGERSEWARLLKASGLEAQVDPETPMGAWIPAKGVVRITVAYWRKVNAVHAWFVRECQDGVDECEYSDPISREKLTELRDTCKTVLEKLEWRDGTIVTGTLWSRAGMETLTEPGRVAVNPAVALEALPPVDGFFFGGIDVDEWYAFGLERTITQIDRALTAPDDTVFRYRSSW